MKICIKHAEWEVQSGIVRLIPCPNCPDSEAYCLNVEDLIVAATYNMQQEVKFWCEQHVFPLRTLLPDVFLADLKVIITLQNIDFYYCYYYYFINFIFINLQRFFFF